MTVQEVSKLLGLGLMQTYEAVHRNEIPHIRLGKRILVLRQPLERLLRGEAAQ